MGETFEFVIVRERNEPESAGEQHPDPAAAAQEPEPVPAPTLSHTAQAAPEASAPKRERPKPNSDAGGSEPGPSDNAEQGSPGGLAYGESGAAVETTNLTRAVIKAIPPATQGDAAWVSLPLGAAGGFTVDFEVDQNGYLVRAEPVELEVPAVLNHLLKGLLILLKSGRFALKADQVSAGRQRFRIEATIVQRQPSDDQPGDARHIRQIGIEYATQKAPGHAFFTFNSGRHVDLTVEPREPTAP
jgi:hypothetical protein